MLRIKSKLQYLSFLYDFLAKKEKFILCALLFFMLFMSIVEFVGVGSIFPFIKMISDPSVIHGNAYLNKLYRFGHFSSVHQFYVFVGLCIFGLIVFKAVLLLFLNYLQCYFIAILTKRLSRKLFSNFLHMPREKFIKRNTSHMMKHLLNDTVNMSSCFLAILTFCTNAIMGTSLVILMITINTKVVILSITSVILLILFCNGVTKKYIYSYSVSIERNTRHTYRIVDEGLKAMRDIKIFFAENMVLDKFMSYQNILAKSNIWINFLKTLPGIFINTFGFGLVLVVLLFLLFTSKNILEILPSLGVIALSIQRLIPSATAITNAATLIRRFKPAVQIVTEVLKETNLQEAKQHIHRFLHDIECIQIKNFSYMYENRTLVFTNVNMTLNKNTIVGLVGPSGSGKSTLVEVIIGLLSKDKGVLKINSQVLETTLMNALGPKKIGYVSQHPVLLDGTILENIVFGCEEEIDSVKLKEIIRITQLEELIRELPQGVSQQLGENGARLSGGQKQRIGIARAMYIDPTLLILDESTSALDLTTEGKFLNELNKWKNNNKIVLMVTHRKDTLSICDRVYSVSNGTVIERCALTV